MHAYQYQKQRSVYKPYSHKKREKFVIYQDVLTTALLEVSLPGAPVSWTRTFGRGLQQALSLWWTTRVNQTRPAQGDSLGQ